PLSVTEPPETGGPLKSTSPSRLTWFSVPFVADGQFKVIWLITTSAEPLFLIVIFTSLPCSCFVVICRLHGLLFVGGQVIGFDGELCTAGTVSEPRPLAPEIEFETVTW